jgi:hypothetical protein
MMNQSRPPLDRVLARVGPHVIYYRDVACDPATISDAEASQRSKTVAEICSENEKGRFHGLMRHQLLAAAASKHHIEVTESERLQSVPAKFRDSRMVSSMTESDRLLARAALRVLHGEDRQKVFQDELSDAALARKGISGVHFQPRALDDAMLVFHDEGDVQGYLDRLSDERTLRGLVDYFGGNALAERVRKLITERAATSNLSQGTAEEEFWTEILTDLPVEIIDPTYTMPSLRGLVYSSI